MLTIRTDLAAEAHALWQESAGETTALPGVRAREGELEGFPLTWVEVLDEEGERALGKPRGRYATLDVSALWRREPEAAVRAARAAAALLEPLLPEEGTVLVAGLGNPAMTPDALGPLTLEHLLITRHLGEVLPDFRPVAALAGGVLSVLQELREQEPEAEWVLTAPRSGQPYDRTRLSKLVRAALIRAGLHNVTMRDLRLDCGLRAGGEGQIMALVRRKHSVTRHTGRSWQQGSPGASSIISTPRPCT